MTYEEAIAYIEQKTWGDSRPGLSRIKELMSLVGNPQHSLTCIHIAGSNGKGSLAAILERVLREAGYKTGLFTSPHLQCPRERIRLNGQMISEERFSEVTENMASYADKMEDHPTQFELYTALGLMYFAEEKVDMAVIEVGMGGELDSTNVIDPPLLSIITNIGMDHTSQLGNNLAEIASAKAGIIKAGSKTVSYDLADEAMEVIEKRCKETRTPLYVSDFTAVKEISHDLGGQSFSFHGKTYKLALLGKHQLKNAATALLAIDVLKDSGLDISEAAVKKALENVSWPARFQVLSSAESPCSGTEKSQSSDLLRENTVILDGGHNPQCAKALVSAIKTYLPGQRPAFVMGIMEDKAYEQVLDIVTPIAGSFFCVEPHSERALDAGILADQIRKRGLSASSFHSCKKALLAAMEEAESVICFGSLYLAGEVLDIFEDVRKERLRKSAIARRKSIPEKERIAKSEEICRALEKTKAFRDAQTILLYRAMPGEVSLDLIARIASKKGKSLAFPLCTSQGIMEARSPKAIDPYDPDAWHKGSYGIEEPLIEASVKIDPEDIDLVVCPLTAFDEDAQRLGMGGGYYDRFLPQAVKANKIGVAFSIQRAEKIPLSSDSHDVGLDAVFTEDAVFPANKKI